MFVGHAEAFVVRFDSAWRGLAKAQHAYIDKENEMMESHCKPFEYDGMPASMTAMRNNGECWGRIRFVNGGAELDVTANTDQYDQADEDALDAFIDAARYPHNVEPAVGWIK